MRVLFFGTLIIFLQGCVSMNAKPVLRIDYKAGNVNSVDCKKVGLADGYYLPYSECGEISVVDTEKQIDISVGSYFGVEYTLYDIDKEECYEVVHHLIHPEMNTPDGQVRVEYRRSFDVGRCMGDRGKVRGVFSWIIEEDWEAVKGKWTFEIIVNESVISKEIFNAY